MSAKGRDEALAPSTSSLDRCSLSAQGVQMDIKSTT